MILCDGIGFDSLVMIMCDSIWSHFTVHAFAGRSLGASLTLAVSVLVLHRVYYPRGPSLIRSLSSSQVPHKKALTVSGQRT